MAVRNSFWRLLTHGALFAVLSITLQACSLGDAAEKEASNGEDKKALTNPQPTTSNSINSTATINDLILLQVDKSHLKAELRTWPEDMTTPSKLLMTLRIAIGKEEGDKQVEGDNKTPEGIYFAQSLLDGSSLPAKYGPKAIPLNFPNPHDQMLKKTGHGIWLHGVEADQRVEQAKVTEGCVAFYNADILTLARWLKPYQAVVMIGKDGDFNQPQDVTAVRDAAQSWVKAWQERNGDAYASFYAPEFRFEDMGVKEYAAYKKRVFKSYKKMKLDMTSMRVFTHPKYAMTIMNQDFNGDNRYISRGRKILYWTRTADNRWEILREVFENRRIELVTFTAGEVAKFSENSPSAKHEKVVQESPSL